MVSQTLLGLVALALWAEWVVGWHSPWTITATVAVSGTVASMSIAAWQAFVSELVPREDFEVQKKLLEHAQAKLAELEGRVARIEAGKTPGST